MGPTNMQLIKFLLPLLLVASCSGFSFSAFLHRDAKAEDALEPKPVAEEVNEEADEETEEEMDEEDDDDDDEEEEDDEEEDEEEEEDDEEEEEEEEELESATLE